jgi:hypothetical protein
LPTIDGAFAKYRQSYSARSPDTSEVTYDDEDRQLTPAEGLQSFDVPPCKNIVLGVPPAKDGEAAGEKYLWAIMPKAIPFALELLPGIVLKRGRLAHTNLTGGADAHCGGEVWFIDSERIVINGGSGRYRPRSSEELEAVARAFKESGYKVASMGWDFGVDAPARSVRGEIKWL